MKVPMKITIKKKKQLARLHAGRRGERIGPKPPERAFQRLYDRWFFGATGASELAAAVGVDRGTLTRWFTRARRPSPVFHAGIIRAAKLYGPVKVGTPKSQLKMPLSRAKAAYGSGMSMGWCARAAGLSILEFQRVLAAAKMPLNYGLEQLNEDMAFAKGYAYAKETSAPAST